MSVAAAVNPHDCSLRLKAPSDQHDTVYHSHFLEIITEITDRQHLPTLTLALEGFAMGADTGSQDSCVVDFAAAVGALRDLQCMELMQCTAPTVPGTLTALTRLAVTCVKERDDCYRWRDFQMHSDLAGLTALRVWRLPPLPACKRSQSGDLQCFGGSGILLM